MAPPSKKQKWRQLDLSATEQYIDDAALHQRVAQLEASDSLFQIDTSGCAPANNLTQRARRLLQQNLLAAEGSAGEGALLRTAPEPKTFKVVPKKPLLQVVSAQHKKQLLKIIRQQQGKEKTTSAQRQNQQCLLEAAARSLLTRPDRASRSCADAGGEREGGLEDLWPGENASSVARKGSSAPFEKKKQSGEEDVQKKQRSDPAAGNAAAGSSCGKGAPPSHERQAVNAAACSSPAAAGQQQQQTRRKRRRCTQQQEKTATEPGAAAAVHTETTEKEGVVTASDDAAAETSHGETLTSRSVAEGDVGRGVRRHKAADFPKKLTVRGLRSFDKLRPYVPVVRLPGDSESYNPSAEASACGLLAAAVRTLEEQREAQKLQRCSSRSSVTRQAEQQQNREKLELLLLANVQQQEIDQQGATRIRGGVEDAKTPQTENKEKEKAEEATEEQQEQQQGGHSRMQRIDDVLSQVLPAEKVVLLTDTQKQRLLLDLVYKGKASLPAGEELLGERQPAANGLPQQEQEWKEAQQQQKQGEETEPLTSNAKAATDVGDEEADSDEGDAAGGDALLSRVKRQEKKTRAERNRRLRFLQQQRRHAAKVAARSWRAVVDRVDVAVQQLDTEAQELARRKEEREEKLRAKILAAKQGQVRLKIGRNRLVEAPTAVQLPEDVTGSLRNAKPAVGASGALCEHVASLRRRGLLELPFTGGATGAALRHAQRQRSRRLASRKPRKRKD